MTREQLIEAKKLLKIASALIYGSASGVKPFRVSKILNIMGKTTYEHERVLSIILGDTKTSDYNPEIKVDPVITLYLVELEENSDFNNSIRSDNLRNDQK